MLGGAPDDEARLPPRPQPQQHININIQGKKQNKDMQGVILPKSNNFVRLQRPQTSKTYMKGANMSSDAQAILQKVGER